MSPQPNQSGQRSSPSRPGHQPTLSVASGSESASRGSLRLPRFVIAILLGVAARGWGAPAAPAQPPISEFSPQINRSVYEPSATRNPFLKPGTSVASTSSLTTADPTIFHLDGYLGSTNNLTAIVNGLALSLNKPVVFETGSGRITIKAVQITFAGVILEVGGKRIELKRATENLTPPAPAR